MNKKISFKDGLKIVEKIQAIKEKKCECTCHTLNLPRREEHCQICTPESNYTKSCTLEPEHLVRTSVSLPEPIPDCNCHCHHEFDVDCDCFGKTDQDKCIHCEPMKIDERVQDILTEDYHGQPMFNERHVKEIKQLFVSLLSEIIGEDEILGHSFDNCYKCNEAYKNNQLRSEIRTRAKERGINLLEVTK